MNFTKSKSIIKNELPKTNKMGITNLNEAFEFEGIIQNHFPQLQDKSNPDTIEKLLLLKREFFVVDKNDSTKFYPKPKFKSYLEHKILFDEFNDKLNDLKNKVDLKNTEAMNEMNFSGRNYTKRRDDSLTRWKVLGNKEVIETILETIVNK
jgi:hypothetical protein